MEKVCYLKFIVINLLETEKLEEKSKAGFEYGWNSLCLCPNCAAEYKYGAISLFDFYDKVKTISINIQEKSNTVYEFPVATGYNRTPDRHSWGSRPLKKGI